MAVLSHQSHFPGDTLGHRDQEQAYGNLEFLNFSLTNCTVVVDFEHPLEYLCEILKTAQNHVCAILPILWLLLIYPWCTVLRPLNISSAVESLKLYVIHKANTDELGIRKPRHNEKSLEKAKKVHT